MKQFIVLLATVPLLLIFMVQFSMDQAYSAKVTVINDCVYTAKEQAKQQGCFTSEILDELRTNLSMRLDISVSEIIVDPITDVAPSVKYRLSSDTETWEASLIRYKFYVKVGDVLAGRSLLRSDAKEYYYVAEGQTTSERLAP